MRDLIDIIKKFGKILTKGQKTRVVILVILMTIGALFEAAGVSLIVPLVSLIIEPDFFTSNKIVIKISDLLGIESVNDFVVMILFSLAALYIIKNLFLFFEYYVQIRFIRNNKLVSKLNSMWIYLNKPYEFFFHANSGEILREVSTDVTNTYNLLLELLNFFTETIITAVLIVTVFMIDSFMAVLVTGILIMEMLAIYKVVKPLLNKAGRDWQISTAQTNKWLLQSFDGIKDIKVRRKEPFFLNKYRKYAVISSDSEMTSTAFSIVPRLLIEAVTVAVMLIIVACMILGGQEITGVLPRLSAFVVAAVKLLPSINRISASMNAMAYNKVALDNVCKTMLSFDKEIKVPATSKMDYTNKLMIRESCELRNITYMYPGTNVKVLDHANMRIPVGSMVGIVGTSGSGKTTTVDILLGLLKEQEGEILVDGDSIEEHREEFLNNIGYIPQQIFMLNDSIRENVAFGIDDDEVDDDMVWTALREAELEDYVRDLEEGLETQLGEKGVRLSGGQRQRVGIARALYANPQILVFDEATSALDNETESAVVDSINSMHGQKTIIIIAHRLTTIENCDIVYRVQDGRIEKEIRQQL